MKYLNSFYASCIMINVEQRNNILKENALPFEGGRKSSLIISFEFRRKPRAEFDRIFMSWAHFRFTFFVIAHAHNVRKFLENVIYEWRSLCLPTDLQCSSRIKVLISSLRMQKYRLKVLYKLTLEIFFCLLIVNLSLKAAENYQWKSCWIELIHK